MKVFVTTVDEVLNDSAPIDSIFDSLHFISEPTYTKQRLKNQLNDFLLSLRLDLKIIIETEYVDKVYRDSFYRFYSTKLRDYYRNCVRLSFFEPHFDTKEDFLSTTHENLQNWYDGFLILRPLSQSIGRNAIAKRAKISSDINICEAPIKSTCMGAKLIVNAFPHSSQDGEYLSCAETTIWSILEYFGNKYNLYNPVLPTEVVDSLDSSAFERLTPTHGLSFQQLSWALKKHGLSTKIYTSTSYSSNPEKFRELFNCYIESGFPLAVCLMGKTGHAVVCIGRKPIDPNNLTTTKSIFSGANNYIFWNSHKSEIVFNDDNYPCYQPTTFDNPTSYYTDPNFQGLTISHFIVPLHCKIYLPAEIAIDASNYIVANIIKAPDRSCVKTFLTSNRTYREYLLNNPDINTSLKQAFLQIEMPKFVWVTEISTHNQLINGKVNAIILLDATGNKSNHDDLSQLIYLQFLGNGHMFNKTTMRFEVYINSLPLEFKAFEGNLK